MAQVLLWHARHKGWRDYWTGWAWWGGLLRLSVRQAYIIELLTADFLEIVSDDFFGHVDDLGLSSAYALTYCDVTTLLT